MSDGFIKLLLWHMDEGKEWQDGERERDPDFPHEQPKCDTLLRAIKKGKSTKVKTYFKGKRTSFNISSVAKQSI